MFTYLLTKGVCVCGVSHWKILQSSLSLCASMHACRDQTQTVATWHSHLEMNTDAVCRQLSLVKIISAILFKVPSKMQHAVVLLLFFNCHSIIHVLYYIKMIIIIKNETRS